jgi:hypothetical protein
MLLMQPWSQHWQTSHKENLLGDPNFAGEMRDIFLQCMWVELS